MTHPRGAVGWSAVCDCGYPDHPFLCNYVQKCPIFISRVIWGLTFIYNYAAIRKSSATTNTFQNEPTF